MYNKYKPYFLVLPFLLIMVTIFIGGVINGIIQSLGYLPMVGLNEITFKFYSEVLKDKEFINSLSYTLYISLVSSIISVLIGVFIAFLLNKVKKDNKLSYALYQTPIIIPHLVAVLMISYIISQTGIISRVIYALGIVNDPSQFPLFVYDNKGIGIILVYLYKQVPFVTMTVYAVLKNLNKGLRDVSLNLGASPRQTLFYVILPLLAPSILSAFLITFAFDFGAFEVPFLLGSPSKVTLPVKAYIDYINPDFAFRPYTMVINMIISIISMLLVWGYMKIFKHFTRQGREGGII
ncbi:ABC transporter permease subunit [Clostridium sp.]|uniref:ABC transporter permease n=1 Tax=Clostridium sp. TaxID=1506 RepID=UPI002FCB4AA2